MGRRRRVLVVEDDLDLIASLREVLEEEGHAVMTATDGHEALRVCATSARAAQPDAALPIAAQRDSALPIAAQPDAASPIAALRDSALPDVVLIDLHLGGPLSGAPLLAALRQILDERCRFYLLSGEAGLAERAPQLGADGWLEKPFAIEALLALIERPIEAAMSPAPTPR